MSSPHPPTVPAARRYLWWAGAAAVLVVIAVVWSRQSEGEVVIDLVADLPKATEQRPEPSAFRAINAIQNGVFKPSIYVAEPSRLVFRLDAVPSRAWLRVAFGVREEAWGRESPGVLFAVALRPAGDPSRRAVELASMVVNPFGNHADRQWLPVLVDLAPWDGQAVDLIFETRAPNEHANLQHHLALWGAPAIVTK